MLRAMPWRHGEGAEPVRNDAFPTDYDISRLR